MKELTFLTVFGTRLVPFLITACWLTSGLNAQDGPCKSFKSFVRVTEDVQRGIFVKNWTSDRVIASHLTWDSTSGGICEEYFNVTEVGLVTNKVIDVDTADFGPSNAMRCGLRCQDDSLIRPFDYVLTVLITAVNEFSPEFKSNVYSINMTENTPKDLVIFTANTRTEVTDKDKDDKVSRYMLQPIPDDVFYISNPLTGEIVLKTGNLDYETGIREFNRTLIAIDDGYSYSNVRLNGSTTLIFRLQDVDDQGPAFRNETYQIDIQEENTTIIGHPLSTHPPLAAYDQDLGINNAVLFRLKTDPTDLVGTFRVDPDGRIQVLKKIDREKLPLTGSSVIIPLVIEAYENSTERKSSSTTVTVNIIDVEDHLPEFKQLLYSPEITEHPEVGSTVIYITATDADEGENAKFQYVLHNDPGYFNVLTTPEGTGLITVVNGSALDREKTPIVTIKIGTNKGEVSEATIKVKLLDINDNAPIFESSTYTFEIKDSTGSQNGSSAAVVGEILGKVSATDKDEGENAQISYSFGSPGSDTYLNINGNSGEITVIKTPLPLEGEVSSMEFYIKATDNGSPTRDTITRVKVIQYGDDVSSYLYANVAANLLKRDKDQLEKNMSSIIGVDLSLEEIVPDNKGGIDLSRSRIQLSAKYSNGTHVSRTILKRLITEKNPNIQALFDAYNRKPDPIILNVDHPGLSPSEIALIAIGGIILIAAIFLIMVFCRMKKQLKLYKSLTSNMSRRPTIYESQEIKLDITVETSDYGKDDSLDSLDIENEDIESIIPNGNLVVESPVGNEIDGDGNPLTVWNPVFAGENDAANISELTQLKQYYTYPNMLNFGEDYSSEDVPEPTDRPENETRDLTNHGPGYEHVVLGENIDGSNENLYALPHRKSAYENVPQEGGNEDITEGNNDNMDDHDGNDRFPLDDTDHVEASHQKSVPEEPTDSKSEPSHAEGLSDEPSMSQPELHDKIINLSKESPLDDSYVHESGPDNSEVPPPPPIPDRLYDPKADYDMDADARSPPAAEIPPGNVPGILIQPNTDYDETESDPSMQNQPTLPEPKPDYNKVSFADTAVAIHEDDVVEIIKQPLTDNNGGDDGNAEDEDSESQVSSEPEETPAEPVQLISDPINRPTDNWEPSGHLDSDFVSPVTVAADVTSQRKKESFPSPSGFTNPSFVMDENDDSPVKSEEDEFFFSEVSTRF